MLLNGALQNTTNKVLNQEIEKGSKQTKKYWVDTSSHTDDRRPGDDTDTDQEKDRIQEIKPQTTWPHAGHPHN